jgi:hypothetical protein
MRSGIIPGNRCSLQIIGNPGKDASGYAGTVGYRNDPRILADPITMPVIVITPIVIKS